jgi:hypothetical protein
MRECNHIKSDGRPCNAPALRKHSYCFFHQQQLNRRRREYPDRLPILEDRAAVQVAIMQVLDRLYLKTIDYKAAALMLYGLQLASTNLKQDIFARLNSEKVDRYYGNANEIDQSSAPSKPALGSSGNVLGAPYLPEVGRCGSVPEARVEGSPAPSAGFQASSSTEVPEGRPNTLGGGAYKLDERAAEFERLFNSVIPEIKACTDDTAENGCKNEYKEKLDAPPLSRSDRVGNENTLNCCHSDPERAEGEEALSSPNTLSDAPHLRAVRRCGCIDLPHDSLLIPQCAPNQRRTSSSRRSRFLSSTCLSPA